MISIGDLQGSIAIEGVGEAVDGLDSVGKSSSQLSSTFEDLSVVAKKALSALAIGTTFKEGVTQANALQKALNTFGAQTGATTKELDGMKDAIKEIYNNGLGESFDDIAESMAIVSQQTGATGEQLEEITSQAMVLRDTFGWDVNESIRAVNMMMHQFGITSQEAYNLLAQGVQNGLDKNGDLLDTINEYSVHYKQLGLDAEDMFNSLANGVEAGTFSVDKLSDSVKEFGIRAKDACTSTIEAYEALGLNADNYLARMNEGGEVAEQAMNEIVTALFNCNDAVVQNTAGVGLFGRW